MVFKDIKEYFRAVISVASALLPQTHENDKLTPKEIDFLVLCCVYYHQGNNLDRFSLMARYIVQSGEFKNNKEVSQYKTKLGVKKWIKAERDTFELNDLLIQSIKQPMVFKITYEEEAAA